ncbi:MAG: Gfo/Idh/MocA family protein [Planctomycetota bacterium]|jgi:predicted dehydrogenase
MPNIGVIGLGFMGRMHLAAYNKIADATIVAVSDQDEKRAAGDLSGGWGNIEGAVEKLNMKSIKGTIDYNELLGWDDVDIVDICTPTPGHEEVALAALASGKHVICEKPLAVSLEATQRIADAAAEAEGFFMPAHCMRFWPQWDWIKQQIDAGTYGKVLGATFRRVASMPPGWFANGAISGGGILDLHIHDTDFISYAFGKPDAVSSRGYTKTSGLVDHVNTQYIYNDGPPLVTAEGSWCMADGFEFSMRCTVNFENATADFDIMRDPPLVVYKDGEREIITIEGDGYANELAYFIECVKSGTPPTRVTAQDAVTSFEILMAETKSIETGENVKL